MHIAYYEGVVLRSKPATHQGSISDLNSTSDDCMKLKHANMHENFT